MEKGKGALRERATKGCESAAAAAPTEDDRGVLHPSKRECTYEHLHAAKHNSILFAIRIWASRHVLSADAFVWSPFQAESVRAAGDRAAAAAGAANASPSAAAVAAAAAA